MNLQGSVYSVDTVLNADCVAWCPHPDRTNLLLCSTYQLVDQKRTGSLLLFDASSQPRLLQTVVNLHGIFHFKWSPAGQEPLVALADSDGQIILLKLDEKEDVLRHLITHKASEAMALYVDWLGSRIAASFSDGSVSVFEVGSADLEFVQSMQNHTLEAWFAVFDVNDPDVLYSGGDDCLLTKYDLRSRTLASKNRYHSAGVTHIMTNELQPEQLVSGSYDELICQWDKRNFKRPVNELGLGGGVWRIQAENGVQEPRLAAACMFKGFKFLSCNIQGFEEIGGFRTEEGCLAYGVGLSVDNKVAMCTFYDHSLQISVNPFEKFVDQ